jgi:hypothetical protein
MLADAFFSDDMDVDIDPVIRILKDPKGSIRCPLDNESVGKRLARRKLIIVVLRIRKG